MKVLVVVEDSDEMQMIIRHVLSRDDRIDMHGTASTAEEAIAEARSFQPDLIILDHFIEGEIMGLQAAPMLKEVAPQAKIVLFTDHDLRIEAEREPAVDAYLPKKQLNDLLATVRRLVGLSEG